MLIMKIKFFVLLIFVFIVLFSNSALLKESKNVLVFTLSHNEIDITQKEDNLVIKQEDAALYILMAQDGDSVKIKVYKDSNINNIFEQSDSMVVSITIRDDSTGDEYLDQPRIIKYLISSLVQKYLDNGLYFFTSDNFNKYDKLKINVCENSFTEIISQTSPLLMPNGFGLFQVPRRVSIYELNRVEKAKALGQSGRKNDIQLLFMMLDDESVYVQEKVIDIISQLKNDTVIIFLYNFLNDRNHERRTIAIEILNKMNNPRIVDLYIFALKDSIADIRLSAIKALRKIWDPKAVPPLINLLNDKNIEVRKSVIEALGYFGDKRATEPLILSLNDQSQDIQLSTIRALSYLCDLSSIESLLNLMEKSTQSFKVEIANALDSIILNNK
ncbi:MAG: HEAT repeat domain-containing protein [Methanosarcinaceae archaeon]